MAKEGQNVGRGPRGPRKLSKDEMQKQGKSLAKVLAFVWQNYKIQCIAVVLCIALSAIGFVAIILFLQQLVDGFINPMLAQEVPDFGPLAERLAQMAGIAVFTIAAMLAYNEIMVYVSNGSLRKIRCATFNNMESLPIKYFDTNAHGDIMSVYTNDVDTLMQLIRNSLPQAVNSLFNLIATFVGMVILNIPLTIVSCCMVAVMIFVTTRLGGLSGRYFSDQQRDIGKLNGFIEEAMTGQKVIKVFCHEEESTKDFKKLNEQLCKSATRANVIANITMPINGNLSNLNYVLIAVIGALLALNGFPGMTVGTVVSFLSMCKAFTQPVTQLSMQVGQIVMAGAGAGRIFKLCEEVPEVNDGTTKLVRVKNEGTEIIETDERTGHWAWKQADAKGSSTLTPLAGKITFNNVDFGYTDEKQILFDINMFAEPGQKIAFVGSTGAGKTTMTNLINRFYDVQGGTIEYDGIDVKNINKDDLRKSLGIVLQDTHLFADTVMENIRYGRLDATDEECIEAAKIANADGFIRRLPNGYNARLTADGANLSQGQRQLLSIARATVADPPALILDEATSAIDTHTEALVQEGMDKLMAGRTSFVIAHRLSTIKNADCIMVMEAGRIIERGTHDELMTQRGRYYTLYTGKAADDKAE